MWDYKKIIAEEMEYQRKRLYKRLKTSDNGRVVVEYWKGAKNFLNAVHGIEWEVHGRKILIKEKKADMKTFHDILTEAKFKIGDKVKIVDSPAHRKHGQKHGIGETGTIDSMSGKKIWVKYGDPSEERKGMGYEVSTIQVEPKDLKKLKESTADYADIEFVLIQFQNDEASSDKEMVKHLTKETGLSRRQVKDLVDKGRDMVLQQPLTSTDHLMHLLMKIAKVA